MTEKEWMEDVKKRLEQEESFLKKKIFFSTGKRVPYSFEVLSYLNDKPDDRNIIKYETDLLVYQKIDNEKWKPRIIIEGKINSVTTHDAITYSQKASTHKNVHPYLRYGILLGNRKHYPLPGRLFRHGAYFDFMLSWKAYKPAEDEWKNFLDIINSEIEYSKKLEEILFHSRSKNRKRYTILHRPLYLK
ncbi:hypothetical protein ES704_00922 [subsurface metagenome]|jgi:hypothetical protein